MPIPIRALLLLSIVGAAAGAQTPASWPFGGSGFDGRDLMNLGVVGAKAWNADVAAPGPRTAGKQSFEGGGTSHAWADVGPARLRIEVLFPDGPAAKAGLKPGDVIVGVEGGAPFDKGSRKALADALRKALAAPKPQATFQVEVGGDRAKVKKIAVMLPPAKEGGDHTKPAVRAAWAKAACAWLATKQQGDGGYPETLSGMNGAVVQASVAGLAWIAAGSTATKGPHAAAVAKARAFVAKNVDAPDRFAGRRTAGDSNWNQENWGWCHAALFLGELALREPSPALKADLQRCADALVKNQEKSGGWAHGPGGANGLGYVELNIMASLALGGLGLAQQAGCTVPKASVMKAVDYVEASSSGGGVGYSTDDGQKGQGNIGRSAGCWLGYRALGLGQRPAAGAMRDYVAREIGAVLGGHASLMQQTLLAGVAAAALGEEGRREFWSKLGDDALLARAPDGSLQPRPWHESVSMSSNSDVSTGQVWTTAAWAIVLAAEGPEKPMPGLVGWAGLKKP